VTEFSNNWPVSSGLLIYPNGDRFEGDINKGIANGRGVYTFADSSRYVGPVKNDRINGHGTITYSNGDRYVGDLWNGKPQGLGRKKFAEDRVPLEGRWDEGRFVKPERIR
jgi:hypothetical protein